MVLTDRGTEFCDPLAIEQSSNGDMLTSLFYCDSYSSYQKGAIEENHTILRRIIPKNTLFDSLSQEQANIDAKLCKVCKELDIPPRSVHKLRKTYISRLMNQGLNPDFIRE